MLHLILMNKIYISKFLYEISDRPVRSECDVQRSRLIVMIPDNLWPNISTPFSRAKTIPQLTTDAVKKSV